MPFSHPSKVKEALMEYYARKNRVSIPVFRYNTMGYRIPDHGERQPCCQNVPARLMWWHLHSPVHIANLYGVMPRDLMVELAVERKTKLANPPDELQVSSLRLRARDFLPRDYEGWYDFSSPNAGAVPQPSEPLPWGVT